MNRHKSGWLVRPSALPKINAMRTKMVSHGLKNATATCPWCGEKDALHLRCAIGYNNHISGKCSCCDMEFME